jgi:hypothetical protein
MQAPRVLGCPVLSPRVAELRCKHPRRALGSEHGEAWVERMSNGAAGPGV